MTATKTPQTKDWCTEWETKLHCSIRKRLTTFLWRSLETTRQKFPNSSFYRQREPAAVFLCLYMKSIRNNQEKGLLASFLTCYFAFNLLVFFALSSFQLRSKVIARLLRFSSAWLKSSRGFFHQWEAKPKKMSPLVQVLFPAPWATYE